MISLDQEIIVSSEVLSQEVDGETVLLDMKSENYFGLDEVGTRIWQLLSEGRVLQELFDILLAEYEVEEAVLQKDMQEHLDELLEAGLISLASAE